MAQIIRFTGSPPIQVPVDSIEPPSFSLRVAFEGEEGELRELGESMLSEGQMRPLAVFDLGNGRYRCVTGDRGLRAAKAVDASMIWITVIPDRDEVDTICYQMQENIHRLQMDPYEQAAIYRRLLDLGLSVNDIASRVKKNRDHVMNRLKFASASAGVHEHVVAGKLSAAKAAIIAELPDGADQVAVADIVAADNLTVPQTRELVSATRNQPRAGKPRHYISKDKTLAESARVVRWLYRVLKETNFRALTPEDYRELKQVFGSEMLGALKQIIATLEQVSKGLPTTATPEAKAGNVSTARNHRDEWPSGDLQKLGEWKSQAVRKPIEVLADELGRTVPAVRAKLHEVSVPRKRA